MLTNGKFRVCYDFGKDVNGKRVRKSDVVVEVALTKNRDLALNAFMNDPLVTIDIKCAEELFNQMLENTRKYLPRWEGRLSVE